MVTVPELLAVMATRIATVPGIKGAYYPVPNSISKGPVVVLYWGSDVDTAIENDMRERRMWTPAVKAQILLPRKGDTPQEFARVDALIHPIVDIFDAGPAQQVLGLNVNRCQVERIRPTLQIEYAGSLFYGAELYFTVKFHRSVAT